MNIQLNLDAFRADGIVILKDLFTGAERRDLASHWEKFSESLKTNGRNHSDNLIEVLEQPPAELAEFFRNPKLIEVAKRIYGENIAIYLQRFLLKDDNYRGTAWLHHDAPYSRGDFDKVAIFVALTEANPQNGGLYFYRESHKLGFLGPSRYTADSIGSVNLERFAECDLEVICPDLTCGDVVVTHYLTWHGSDPAEHAIDRAYAQVIYQPASDGSGTGLVSGNWTTDIGLRENAEGKLYIARYH